MTSFAYNLTKIPNLILIEKITHIVYMGTSRQSDREILQKNINYNYKKVIIYLYSLWLNQMDAGIMFESNRYR